LILEKTRLVIAPPRGQDIRITGAVKENPAPGEEPPPKETYRVRIEIPGLTEWPHIEALTFEHPNPEWDSVYGVIIGQDILRDCTLLVIGPNVVGSSGSFTLTFGMP
jgi:hypothetical protein